MKTKFASKLGVVGLLLAGLTSAVLAAPKMSAKSAHATASKTSSKAKVASKATQVTGTVTSLRGIALTIKPVMKSNGASKTVMVPKTASVTANGKKAALSSVKTGDKVTIFSNGGKITRIADSASAKPVKKAAKAKKK